MNVFLLSLPYNDHDRLTQSLVVETLASKMKVKKISVLFKIFRLSNPKITVQGRDEVVETFRLEEESKGIFMVILKQYLKEAM